MDMNELMELALINDAEPPLQQMQGGEDPPPPPDYTGAAKETAYGNEQAARVGSTANRVNQYGPGGSIVYARQPGSFDQAGYDAALAAARASGGQAPNINLYGNPDQYQVTTTLSPQQQELYGLKGQTDIGLANLANTGVNKAQGLLSNPELDLSNVSPRVLNAGTNAQQAVLSRLQPQIDRQREALRTQLLNQGIGMGNEAYRGAFDDQNRRENDLMTAAAIQGIGLDQQSRQQGIQEQAFLQDRPLNLINALRSGTQVQGPQFMQVPQQATAQGPDYLTAAGNRGAAQTNMYNQQVGRQNAITGGLFDLGASALGSYNWG